MREGTIVRVNLEGGFGFLIDAESREECFFHQRDLRGLEFDSQLQERFVWFDMEVSPRGPKARHVRAAE